MRLRAELDSLLATTPKAELDEMAEAPRTFAAELRPNQEAQGRR